MHRACLDLLTSHDGCINTEEGNKRPEKGLPELAQNKREILKLRQASRHIGKVTVARQPRVIYISKPIILLAPFPYLRRDGVDFLDG